MAVVVVVNKKTKKKKNARRKNPITFSWSSLKFFASFYTIIAIQNS